MMQRILLFVAAILMATTIAPQQTFAIDLQFFSANNILYYDPDACPVGESLTKEGDTTVSVKKDATSEQIFKLLIEGGFNGGQAAAIMGNLFADSGFNSDLHEEGNDIGYGLSQWSLDRRDRLEAYAKSEGVVVADIPTQITFLVDEYNETYKSRLSAGAFKDGKDIAGATELWLKTYEDIALTPATDPAKLNTVRIPAALQIYEYYKDIGPTVSGSVSTSNCVSGNGVVAGDIVKTAIGLAWPDPITTEGEKINKEDATEAYQVAKEQYNPAASNGVPSYSDCGGFVATVMISTGIDPNYVKVGTGNQIDYVTAHPEKYKVLTGIKSIGDLLPGDILIFSSATAGHTIIYTGPIDGTANVAVDASLDQRVPSQRGSYSVDFMFDNNSIVARVLR